MPRYIAPLGVSSKTKTFVAQGVGISDEVLPFRSSALEFLNRDRGSGIMALWNHTASEIALNGIVRAS